MEMGGREGVRTKRGDGREGKIEIEEEKMVDSHENNFAILSPLL